MINDPRVGEWDLAELVDGELPEGWDSWQAANPDAAREVLLARRVRALVLELRSSAIAVPADFEARLLARVRGDQTALDLLELALDGAHRVLLEILTALLQLFPRPTAAAR